MAQWTLAATARNDFADMIEGLTPEQLTASTFCEGWTPKHVLAHLVSFPETSGFGLVRKMAKARGDFDKVTAAMLADQIDKPVAELVALLRKNGPKSAPLPGFPEGLTVGDVSIHT